MKTHWRLVSACNASLFLLLFLFQSASVRAQSEVSLAKRIEIITSRPEFAHANFGIEFYSLETGKVLYSLNADKLFVPASTTKILTEGASTGLARLTSTAYSRATSSSSLAATPISRIVSSPTTLSPSSITTIPTTAPRFPAILSPSSSSSLETSPPKAFARSKAAFMSMPPFCRKWAAKAALTS